MTRAMRSTIRFTGPLPARGAGFTMFELVLVIAVLSIILAISAPSIEGLVPKYRVRSAIRELGSRIESVRISAIGREKWMGIHYDLEGDEDGPFYRIIPPAPEEDPLQPVENRELLQKHHLPVSVRIARVVLAQNQGVDRGTVNVLFSPAGNVGSHGVVLEGPDGRLASLKLSSITGILEFSETGEVAFEHFEG